MQPVVVQTQLLRFAVGLLRRPQATANLLLFLGIYRYIVDVMSTCYVRQCSSLYQATPQQIDAVESGL
jgi:hypothetical protein